MYVAARLAEHLRGAVGQHLVGVHVVRGAGAGLIHVDDELIAERAGQNLVGGGDDGARDLASRAGRAPRWPAAAAFLTRMVAVTRSGAARRPLIGKFSTARAVCTP